MPEFSVNFTKSVANACQELTVTDTSNYSNNTDDISKSSFYVREVTLRGINGNLIEVKNIPANSDSVTFNIGSLLSVNQLYLDIALRLGGFSSYEIRKSGLLPCIL